jgi:hypothetical protein
VIADAVPPLVLSVGEDVDVFAADGTEISITIESRSESAGSLSLTAHTFSALQVATIPLGDVAIEWEHQSEIGIPVTQLALASEALEFSGTIDIEGRVAYLDGHEIGIESVTLFFHPEGAGWRIYDRAARDAVYDGGALTAEARAIRDEALNASDLTEAPDAVTVFGGAARGAMISDDPEFVPESAEEQ